MADLKQNVLIVGAGCTGLLLAQGLKHANIPFEIFDRDAEDRPQREWGMSLHWGGEYLASILPPALQDRLNEIDCDPFYDPSKDVGFVQCNGQTGEVILMMAGKMPRRVSRQKLRTLLSEGITIQHAKQLTTIDTTTPTSVTATFSDTTTATGTLLIGCDGSCSTVRSLLFKDLAPNHPSDITILNFPASYSADTATALRAIHPIFKVSYHPTLNVMYLLCILSNPDPSAPEKWKYQNLLSWRGAPFPTDLPTPSSRVAHLHKLGAHFAEPWRSAALSVPDDATLSVDAGAAWDPRPVWDSKGKEFARVTLAGDAAHNMLPHRGQGLNHALQDARELVGVLSGGEVGVEEAVVAYEREMVERGGLEVEVSGRQGRMAHDWVALMESPIFKMGANRST